MKNFGKLSCEFGAYFNQKLVINLPTSYCTKGDHYYILRRSVQNLGIMVLRSRAAVWFFSPEKWYFVTKIVLTHCEKKLFLWSRKSRGWKSRICKIFENTWTIFSNNFRTISGNRMLFWPVPGDFSHLKR